MRLRLDLAYDGTAFHGWATQAGGLRTVQSVVESALRLVFQQPSLRTVVAGRTDAGVHALAQVVHVDVPVESFERMMRPTESLTRTDLMRRCAARLRSVLGRHPDIELLALTEAPAGFDARFSALSRTYHYRLADLDTPRNPLRRYDTYRVRAELDVERMNSTAQALTGLHDWYAFAKPKPHATTIRDLHEFTWRRAPDGTIVARLVADAFCHHQVRYLVGGTLMVGLGEWSTADLIRIRDTKIRPVALQIAPPHGLTLVEVQYPADHALSDRARLTQGRRVLDG